MRRGLSQAAHLPGVTTSGRTFSGLEPRLTIEELSEYLAVPVRTLYDWRQSGRGPRAVHVGRQLRYFVNDVHDWLEQQRETVAGGLMGELADRTGG